MNKAISADQFSESFKGSDVEKNGNSTLLGKKMISAMAVCAMLTMSGCATTSNDSSTEQLTSNSSYSQLEQAPSQLNKITNDNALDIIEKQQSGVYQNPYNANEIVTIAFHHDANSEANIKADFDKIGEGSFGYGWSQMLDSIVTSSDYMTSGQSHHIQDPIGLGKDVNYIKLNTVHISQHVLSDSIFNETPEYQKYSSYFIMQHEIAHGFDSQQMSLLDIAVSAFSKDMLVTMENGSDITGAVSTIQLMTAEGEDKEFINGFLDAYVEARTDDLSTTLDKSVKQHASGGSIAFVQTLYNDNPSFIIDMTPEEIVDFSDIVSSTVNDHDYRADVEYSIAKSSNDKTGKITEAIEGVQKMALNDPFGYRSTLSDVKNKLDNGKMQPEVATFFTHILEAGPDIKDLEKDEVNSLSIKILTETIAGKSGKIDITTAEGQKALKEANVHELPFFNQVAMDKLESEGFKMKIEPIEVNQVVSMEYDIDNSMKM